MLGLNSEPLGMVQVVVVPLTDQLAGGLVQESVPHLAESVFAFQPNQSHVVAAQVVEVRSDSRLIRL
ncbi:MAG: hypothetical protein AAGC60_23440 [Acidobacteriota bacterium]